MSNLPSIAELIARKKSATLPASVSASFPVKAPTASPTPQTPPPTPSPALPKLADKDTAEKFSEKMEEINLREKEEEAERTAGLHGLPYINLKGFPINADALGLIPKSQAQALRVIPFVFTGPELRLATSDPANAEVNELSYALGERHKTNVKLYFVSAASLQHGLKLYDTLPKITPIVKGVRITEEELARFSSSMTDVSSIAGVLTSTNISDVLSAIIAAAVRFNSSDIHIEAEEKGIAVRLRIDGFLQEIAVLDREKWKKIINRIKLVASLKLNVTKQAQDGRFTIFQNKGEIDVRTSTIPTSYGESVVMRLLNPESIALSFDELGFRPLILQKLTKEIEKPNGMIVTTGPTGSGKTTTLYAILQRLNTPDVKIITLEDPVEYKVEGLNQSQIDISKDYTFAKGLRSTLRQDPDIVMVGEIRDLETAEIAIQASLTGHLMLSTIHTNDAAGAVPRFLSMGVKPYLLAPAINAIMGQRLVRRLCKECKVPATLDADTLGQVQKILAAIPDNSGETKPDPTRLAFFGPKGCKACNTTGYKGRVGVYELIVRDADLEKTIIESQSISEYQMRDLAARQGMVTMAQDGILKALDGLTSIDEVKRVVGL